MSCGLEGRGGGGVEGGVKRYSPVSPSAPQPVVVPLPGHASCGSNHVPIQDDWKRGVLERGGGEEEEGEDMYVGMMKSQSFDT